ncbi:MAG: sulfotransferase [Ignavibacteria bacterium]|jgi:hypothetical protein
MKLIYIISQGHSGSTLLDLILGTHPGFISSGEMRYLNWQLERTKNKKATFEDEDICTCGKDFRKCNFWSNVFEEIKSKTGIDIIANPRNFNLAYFNSFSYQERDGFARSFLDKAKGFLVREWLEKGKPLNSIKWIEPKIDNWIKNNWLLYESMSKVAEKPIVIDSSKHLTIALLLQQSRPKDVMFIFIHRSIEGLAASSKRWSLKKNKKYDLMSVVKSKQKFEQRIKVYKEKIPDLRYIEVEYEHFVKNPADLLDKIVQEIDASKQYHKQLNNLFYVDPTQHHLVAGNPMRYKGKQLVKYDERWKDELTQDEINLIYKYNKFNENVLNEQAY